MVGGAEAPGDLVLSFKLHPPVGMFAGDAAVAQLVAHRTCNAGVRGSSPLGGSVEGPLDLR